MPLSLKKDNPQCMTSLMCGSDLIDFKKNCDLATWLDCNATKILARKKKLKIAGGSE